MAIYGDVNGDGVVDMVDALWIRRAALGEVTLSPDQLRAADLDGDGKVTTADALAIAEFRVGVLNDVNRKIGTPIPTDRTMPVLVMASVWERWAPAEPHAGPPLPRKWNIYWPGFIRAGMLKVGLGSTAKGNGAPRSLGGGYRSS